VIINKLMLVRFSERVCKRRKRRLSENNNLSKLEKIIIKFL